MSQKPCSFDSGDSSLPESEPKSNPEPSKLLLSLLLDSDERRPPRPPGPPCCGAPLPSMLSSRLLDSDE
uniref:Uncharacterized protein n=1 Tax=Panagrellus redivivus TaxID=6233 RepID=A0A7E4VEM9_PANRE